MTNSWRISGDTAAYQTQLRNSAGEILELIMSISWQDSGDDIRQTEQSIMDGNQLVRISLTPDDPFTAGIYARLTVDGTPSAMIRLESSSTRPASIREFAQANDPGELCQNIFAAFRETVRNPGSIPRIPTTQALLQTASTEQVLSWPHTPGEDRFQQAWELGNLPEQTAEQMLQELRQRGEHQALMDIASLGATLKLQDFTRKATQSLNLNHPGWSIQHPAAREAAMEADSNRTIGLLLDAGHPSNPDGQHQIVSGFPRDPDWMGFCPAAIHLRGLGSRHHRVRETPRTARHRHRLPKASPGNRPAVPPTTSRTHAAGRTRHTPGTAPMARREGDRLDTPGPGEPMQINGWEVTNNTATAAGKARDPMGNISPIIMSVSWSREREKILIRTLIGGQPYSVIQLQPPPGNLRKLELFAAANPAQQFLRDSVNQGLLDPGTRQGTIRVASHEDDHIRVDLSTILSWPETPPMERVAQAQEFVHARLPEDMNLTDTILELRTRPGSGRETIRMDAANLLEMQVNDIFGKWGAETLLTTIAQRGTDEKEKIQAQIAGQGDTPWTIGISMETPSPKGMIQLFTPPAPGPGLARLLPRPTQTPGRQHHRDGIHQHPQPPRNSPASPRAEPPPGTTGQFPPGEARTLRELLLWHGAVSPAWAPANRT